MDIAPSNETNLYPSTHSMVRMCKAPLFQIVSFFLPSPQADRPLLKGRDVKILEADDAIENGFSKFPTPLEDRCLV